jgi:hypothetical protein
MLSARVQYRALAVRLFDDCNVLAVHPGARLVQRVAARVLVRVEVGSAAQGGLLIGVAGESWLADHGYLT